MEGMKTVLCIGAYFLNANQYRRFGEFYNTEHHLAPAETLLDMIRLGEYKPAMIILDTETYDPDFVKKTRESSPGIMICLYPRDEDSRNDDRYDTDCWVPENITTGDQLADFIRTKIGE